MMDRLVPLVEAVRLARIELECHRDRCAEQQTHGRSRGYRASLESADVSGAMEALVRTQLVNRARERNGKPPSALSLAIR